jgi:SEC-C motif domain protein
MPKLNANLCPCESGLTYQQCCEPLHLGKVASTAEALMRSRYTAYVLELEDYLLTTWHPKTRPNSLNLKEETPIKWLGLQIKYTQELSHNSTIVEFIARYKIGGGKAERLHEISEFKYLDRWYYLQAMNQD